MLLSDPIYYFGTLLAQKQENNWTTFEDMKGRTVATVSGFTLVPELKGTSKIGRFWDQLVFRVRCFASFAGVAHSRSADWPLEPAFARTPPLTTVMSAPPRAVRAG
jgi:hypothetical protein